MRRESIASWPRPTRTASHGLVIRPSGADVSSAVEAAPRTRQRPRERATTRASSRARAPPSKRSRSRTAIGVLADLEGARHVVEMVDVGRARGGTRSASSARRRSSVRNPILWPAYHSGVCADRDSSPTTGWRRDAPVRTLPYRAGRPQRAERYCSASVPDERYVRLSIWSSWAAHSGCALATTARRPSLSSDDYLDGALAGGCRGRSPACRPDAS